MLFTSGSSLWYCHNCWCFSCLCRDLYWRNTLCNVMFWLFLSVDGLVSSLWSSKLEWLTKAWEPKLPNKQHICSARRWWWGVKAFSFHVPESIISISCSHVKVNSLISYVIIIINYKNKLKLVEVAFSYKNFRHFLANHVGMFSTVVLSNACPLAGSGLHITGNTPCD